MNTLSMALAALVGLLAANLAVAADAPAANSQNQLMTDCNKGAATQHLSGAPRKGFMSACLKGDIAPTAPAKLTPQERMKSCNAQATDQTLTGDARKSFMSTCLKG